MSVEKVGFPHPPLKTQAAAGPTLVTATPIVEIVSAVVSKAHNSIIMQKESVTHSTIRSYALPEPEGQRVGNSPDSITDIGIAMPGKLSPTGGMTGEPSVECSNHSFLNADSSMVPPSSHKATPDLHVSDSSTVQCDTNFLSYADKQSNDVTGGKPSISDTTHDSDNAEHIMVQPAIQNTAKGLPKSEGNTAQYELYLPKSAESHNNGMSQQAQLSPQLSSDKTPDKSVPWDPGELITETAREYQFIQPEKLGVQDMSRLGSKGIYVRAMINGYETLMLLDTGASHSILSEDFARFIGLLKPGDKIKEGLTGENASGGKIASYGYRPVSLQINGIELDGDILIGHVNEAGFLGMDILGAAGAVLNFDEMFLQLCEQKIPLLSDQGKRLVNSLITIKQVHLPRFSETIVRLRSVQSVHNSTTGLVEPRQSVLDHYGLLGARNLGASDNLHIKILNPGTTDIHLPPGISLAYFTSQSDLQIYDTQNCHYQVKNLTQLEQESKTVLPEHVKGLYENIPAEITPENREKMKNLLIKYEGVFSKSNDDLGFCDWIQHDIRLKPGTKPIRQAPYRVGHFEDKEIEMHVQTLLDKGIIQREYNSEWSSPCILVKKKDSTTRFCQDYRQVNKVSEQDSYPLPRQDDSLEALSGSKYFTTADLTSGYHQVALSPDAQKISTFVTKSGLYSFKRTPMGLHGAPHTFERLMETVLRGLQWEELLVYMDDIIVFSPDQHTHIERLDRMLHRLQQANLKIKPKKTFIFQKQVEYLGHVVDEQGIHTDPKKIEAIQKICSPKTIGDLRTFLGMTGYYRRFIPNYGEVTHNLYKQLRKKDKDKKLKLQWDEQCEQAFLKLKEAMMSHTILAYPDYTRPFILDTDCSKMACGGVLSQVNEANDERPIAYYSSVLKPAQQNYSATKLEMYALVSAIRHFRSYLYGTQFTCRTDHHSLLWLQNMKPPQGILARWLETLSNYTFTVEHRPGRLHQNADGLSRMPTTDTADVKITEQNEPTAHIRQITPSAANNDPDLTCSFTLSTAEMKEAQNSDPDLKRVIEWIQNDIYPPRKELKRFTLAIRYYLGKRDSLMIKDGLLVDSTTDVHRVIVPHKLQRDVIISFHHDDHAGIDRTYKRIAVYYLWHRMQSQVKDYIQLCHSCQVTKAARNKTNPRSLATGAIMDQISLDIMGSFRPTSNDNTVLLVAVEHFSRWAEAYPLPHASAENCAAALYQGIFSRFGFCRILHMDRAAYFTSELIKELSRLGNCKTTFSCRYHPEGNSMVERMNGTLISSLRTTVQENQNRDWDELVPTIMMAYRATPHPATGMTPNRLMLAREVRLSQVLCPGTDPRPVTDYVKNLDEITYITYNKQRNIQAEEGHFDGAVHKPFNTGDMVLIQKSKSRLNKPGKLESRYTGPYEIKKRLDFDSYVILENGREVIEHHSRLKHYNGLEQEPLLAQGDSPTRNEETISDESFQLAPEATSAISANGQSPETGPPNDSFVTLTRPGRLRRGPPRFDDYFMGSVSDAAEG